jgi:hypothetical protein
MLTLTILKDVEDFKYLGGTETVDTKITREIAIRCQKMVVAYNQLRKAVYECKHIDLKTKFCMFQCCVVTAGVYGCAVWNTSVEDIRHLESCQFRLLRAMCGWTWRQFHSYEDIIMLAEAVGVTILPIEVVIRESRLKYLGHIERMDDSRLTKIVLHGEAFNGIRARGSPEMVFRKVLKDDLLKSGIGVEGWQRRARNKPKWRKLVTKTGRAFQLNGWYEARRVQRVKRHLKRTPEAKAYRDESERESRFSAVLAEAKKFHDISRAMASGNITTREKQTKQAESLDSGKGITKTNVRLQVARLLGCFDGLKVGDGMVTAMERAGDELGRKVEGVIEWKSSSKRTRGYGCKLIGADGCLKKKYRAGNVTWWGDPIGVHRGGEGMRRGPAQDLRKEYLPLENAGGDEEGAMHFRNESDFYN